MDPVDHALLAPPAPRFDAQRAVGSQHPAIRYKDIPYAARHFTADSNAAVAVFHQAVRNRNALCGRFVRCAHIDFAAFDRNAVVAHRKTRA